MINYNWNMNLHWTQNTQKQRGEFASSSQMSTTRHCIVHITKNNLSDDQLFTFTVHR